MSAFSSIGRSARKAAGTVAGASRSALDGGIGNAAAQAQMGVTMVADRRPAPQQVPTTPPRRPAPVVSDAGPTTQIGADENDLQLRPMPAVYHPPEQQDAAPLWV